MALTFGNNGVPIINDAQGRSAQIANGIPTAIELHKLIYLSLWIIPSLGWLVKEKGELVPTIISKNPVDHRLLVLNKSSLPIGNPPKNAGFLGEQNTDFHPLPWTLRPVRTSSATAPQINPAQNIYLIASDIEMNGISKSCPVLQILSAHHLFLFD